MLKHLAGLKWLVYRCVITNAYEYVWHICMHRYGNGISGLSKLIACAFVSCRLRKAGLQLRFVTNVTDETRSEITAKLHSIGVQAAEAEVYTSLQAAKVVVQDNSYEPYCLLPYKAQQEVYSGLSPDQPNSVIIGYSPEHLNYRHMNEAFR